MAEKPSKNNPKKISKPPNPRGIRALVFYIEEILQKYQPLTAAEIQQKILAEKRAWYKTDTIRACLAHLHCYSPTYTLHTAMEQRARHPRLRSPRMCITKVYSLIKKEKKCLKD